MSQKSKILEEVYKSNFKIHDLGLVLQSFGNVSGRHKNQCLIKPSGINLDDYSINHTVSVDLKNGDFNGGMKPSSDTPTHIALYNAFPEIGGIVHTHSAYSTAWAQSGKSIPCLGTTHADYWQGEIPITRNLTKNEINSNYELETGNVIIEKIISLGTNVLDCPGILVRGHGPFTWGKTPQEAVLSAERLEYISRISHLTFNINLESKPISKDLINKHFLRKHGKKSYYGQ